eukprot:1143226-Pelagomonas_calceolata.AAC.7
MVLQLTCSTGKLFVSLPIAGKRIIDPCILIGAFVMYSCARQAPPTPCTLLEEQESAHSIHILDPWRYYEICVQPQNALCTPPTCRAHSSRCTSPSSSVDCNHHSAPTATFVHQKHNPGPPSPRQQPTFYSHPGATTPAPTPTPSAPPSKTLKSAPLSPTPQPHHQQPIDTVYGSMLFTPGGGTVVHQFQPEHTFARNFLHSQPGYSSEEDSPSSQMLDSPFSNKATSCSLSHLPPFNPAHVHVVESGASSEQGWLISPQTSPKVKDLQQQASIGSFGGSVFACV